MSDNEIKEELQTLEDHVCPFATLEFNFKNIVKNGKIYESIIIPQLGMENDFGVYEFVKETIKPLLLIVSFNFS